jgi:nucleoside-diphosphate-sugar epimerase
MILVTGATGYIGNRLVKRLTRDGHAVRAMLIEDDPLRGRLDGTPCEIVHGDIAKRGGLDICLRGIRTVFHLAAVLVSHDKKRFHEINYEGTKNVVDAAVAAGAEHFIYLSGAAAMYRTRTAYGWSKLRAEELMKTQGGTHFTVVRPTLLYGPGGSQELRLYVESLRAFPCIVPVVGTGKARKRPVWLEDVVTGLAALVDNPATRGKTYTFSGGTDISMWDYTKLICETFGIRKPLVPVPEGLCRIAAKVLPVFMKRPVLTEDAILGVTMDANSGFEEAAKDIGYRPISVYEGYRKSFAVENRETL